MTSHKQQQCQDKRDLGSKIDLGGLLGLVSRQILTRRAEWRRI